MGMRVRRREFITFLGCGAFTGRAPPARSKPECRSSDFSLARLCTNKRSVRGLFVQAAILHKTLGAAADDQARRNLHLIPLAVSPPWGMDVPCGDAGYRAVWTGVTPVTGRVGPGNFT